MTRLKLPQGIPEQCPEENKCPKCGRDCLDYIGHEKDGLKHSCIKWHKWT